MIQNNPWVLFSPPKITAPVIIFPLACMDLMKWLSNKPLGWVFSFLELCEKKSREASFLWYSKSSYEAASAQTTVGPGLRLSLWNRFTRKSRTKGEPRPLKSTLGYCEAAPRHSKLVCSLTGIFCGSTERPAPLCQLKWWQRSGRGCSSWSFGRVPKNWRTRF